MRAVFVTEWNAGVWDLEGIGEALNELARNHRLAVVSNTNDAQLVPAHLARLGIAELFASVVLSIEHGYRKPHVSIYEHALTALGVAADRALFVGDSMLADYLGPRAVGMSAWLVDPHHRYQAVGVQRMDSIADLLRVLGMP